MARSAHAYVRGNPLKFYEWLESSTARTLPRGPNGLERALKILMPQVPLMIFTNVAGSTMEQEARDAGMSAVVSKSESTETLILHSTGTPFVRTASVLSWKSRPRRGEAGCLKGIRAITTVPFSEEVTFTLPPNWPMRSSIPIIPTPETILLPRIRSEGIPRPLSESPEVTILRLSSPAA
jgi:hypothetical protein